MDVMEAIKTRRSVRTYSSRPIPDEIMQRLKDALRFAPSACNYQPWHFIFVVEGGLRQELARIARSQRWIADAPLVVVACGFPQQAYQAMGGHGNSAEMDVAIAIDHLTLMAVAEGLGTCWIGAFDESAAKSLLNVPAQAQIVAMLPVGYPTAVDANHPVADTDRKTPEQVFSTNRYDRPPDEA